MSMVVFGNGLSEYYNFLGVVSAYEILSIKAFWFCIFSYEFASLVIAIVIVYVIFILFI